MFSFLRPHGLQHAWLLCPSPSTRICSDLCLLSQWCHTMISSSLVPFSSCPQSFSASGSFPNWLFTSGDQSIGASAFASVLPMNFQGWFALELTGLISLLSKELSIVCSIITVQKYWFFITQTSLWSKTQTHTWILENLQLWLEGPLLEKWCLCFLICCLGLSKLFFQGANVF